jgi:hypothetical protein
MSLFRYMEKRKFRRIDTNLTASICCEPYRYETRIINISEQGVCIHTTMCFPCGTECKLFIPGNDGVLEVQVLVKSITKKEGFNDTMGLELLNSSRKYRDFINSLAGGS